MKLNRMLSAFSLLFLLGLGVTSCNSPIPEPTPTPGGGDIDPTPQPVVGDTLSVADILAMKEDGTLPAKNTGEKTYYVKGYIVGVYVYPSDYTFGLTETVKTNMLIADDAECTDAAKVATVKLTTGTLYQNALNLVDHPENLKAEVLLHGIVEEYSGKGGVVEIDDAYLNGEKVVEKSDIDPSTIDYQEGEMSVSDFVEVEEIKNLEKGKTTTTEYTVRGEVSNDPDVFLSSGFATFNISDGTNSFLCYQTYNVNGDKFVHAKQIVKGDIVTVKGTVTNYNGTKEFKNASLVRTTNTFDPGEIEIETITVAKALEIGATLAVGGKSDNQYKIVGSVASVKEASTSYGNITMAISDESTEKTLDCYRLYYIDNAKYTATDPAVEVGDVVTVIAQINNYNGTIQLNPGYISEHTK